MARGNPYGQCRICKIKFASKDGYCGVCRDKMQAGEGEYRLQRENYIERHSRFGSTSRFKETFGIVKDKFDIERKSF